MSLNPFRYDYPNHIVEGDVWWYYMLELSLYWSLLLSQFTDVKRKDFWEMFVHHVATISLLCFSWTCNLTRAGTIVIALHDVADIFLEVNAFHFISIDVGSDDASMLVYIF